MYYIVLLIIVSLGVLLCEIKPHKNKTKLYLAFSMLVMAVLFTFRYGMGYDFYSYQRIFQSISDNTSFSSVIASTHMKAYPLFTLLNYFVSLFTDNYLVLNALLATIIFSCLGFAVYQFSPIPWVSVFCYITLLHFYMSMNFVRQAMAACVLLLAYSFLKQKRIFPFMFTVLVASSIHFFAIVMIPAYFLVTLKPSPKHYISIASIWLVLFLFSSEILKTLAKISPRIGRYINTIYVENGSSIASVFFSIVCFISILSFSKVLLQKQANNNVLINLSFYGLLFSMFSIRHAILERFSHYFTIFMIFTFAEIAAALKPEPTGMEMRKNNSKKRLKSQWFNYHWYICSLVLVLMLNHTQAVARNSHRVFPYHSIFNEKWRQQVDYIYYEIGGKGWVLREILPEELPEELR